MKKVLFAGIMAILIFVTSDKGVARAWTGYKDPGDPCTKSREDNFAALKYTPNQRKGNNGFPGKSAQHGLPSTTDRTALLLSP